MRISLLLLILITAPCCAGPPPIEESVVPSIPAVTPETSRSSSVEDRIVQGSRTKAIRINGKAKKKPGTTAKTELTDEGVVKNRVKEATQRPAGAMGVESKTIYSYLPDAIYLIYAAINHVVDVQLQPGERLMGNSSIVAGDTHRWEVGTAQEGSGSKAVTHVLIKPKQSGIETNFLITTDKHAYRLYAQAHDDFFVPTVGWSYGDENLKEARKEQQRLDAQVAAPAIIAANLNFKYKIKPDGKYHWTPVRAFDDGQKTYIQMSPETKSHEAPVFFIKDGKKLNLVNYRIRGDYYIVDRLFDEGELRSGKKDKVRIIRETGWFSSEPPRGKVQ